MTLLILRFPYFLKPLLWPRCHHDHYSQAGNLAVLVKTAGESMGLREAMYVFFPGFIAVSWSIIDLLQTIPQKYKKKICVASSRSNLKFVLGVCSLIFPCWRTCISAKQEKCDKNMKYCKYISFLSYGCLLYRYFFIENGLRHAKCQMFYPYEVAQIATISPPGFVEIDLKVFLSRIKCSQMYTYEMVVKV